MSIVTPKGNEVKKTNLYDMYSFGKSIAPLSTVEAEQPIRPLLFELWEAREKLNLMIEEDKSPLLSSARRAATTLINAIDDAIPKDIQEAIKIPDAKKFGWAVGPAIKDAVRALESVLGNDMPDIASYIVSQKGLYRTEDLIAHAEIQLTADVRTIMPEKARDDIREAGRCLAYEVSTACAFHLWRAVETVMGFLFQELTGQTFTDAKVARNWGAYVEALKKRGAPQRITAFLDHIRSEYRNPQTHPEEQVTINDAQQLFGVALSSIEQMLQEIKKMRAAPKVVATVAAPAAAGLAAAAKPKASPP